MKIALFCLIIFAAFLNSSCQRNVESSPVATNEKPVETPQPTPTAYELEVIEVQAKFSKFINEELPTSLEFNGYEIKTIPVKKKYDNESPVTEIYDAILSRKGKTIARFEGEYYPVGNYVGFGLFPFLGGSEKQLLVLDESYKYERDWIVSLTPKFEVLFDSKDYGIWWGRLSAVDIDKDGIYELSASDSSDLGFDLITADMPWVGVIFKYDPKIRKYTPANHLYPEYSLRTIDERVKDFKEGKDAGIQNLLEIMLRYFYAGKENEAWLFFDENFVPQIVHPRIMEDKEKTRERIKNGLNKNPIYKFVQKDLRKQK